MPVHTLQQISDVILPMCCELCTGKVHVRYAPSKGRATANVYHCPHCHQTVRLELPGLIVPPVQIRYND